MTNSREKLSDSLDFDPRYVAARRVLLDALAALTPYGKAFIVAGAQAIYMRTGLNDIAIAPYTTDGDLALDPTLLGDDPKLETTMRTAGFELLEIKAHQLEPGIWTKTAKIDGNELIIPVDLIVPEAAIPNNPGRRGARLGVHGNHAARRAVGLEAVLIDHDTMTISSLDPMDQRQIEVEVAGLAGLLIAKSHKIHDRIASGHPNRSSDKDAADVFRIMQATSPSEIGVTLSRLRQTELAREATEMGIVYIEELFGRRAGEGINMARRALRLAVPDARITTLCLYFTAQLIQTVRG